MVEKREGDAEQLRAILEDRALSGDPRLPDLEESVDRLIKDERLDAPIGSNVYAFLMRAVREGELRGQRDIDAILSGNSSAIPKERPTSRRPSAPKISEIMNAYVGQLRAPRTIREAKEAGSSFVSVVGDLPLDEISRSEVLEYCKAEGARIVGGKTRGSISRPMSASTLKKKVGLIRAAINHAIQTGAYDDANPAVKIDPRHFTKPVPKSVMPDKRPFSVHELQQLVAHPWFTGCESNTRIHQPGNHRLDGMHYWVPILAIYTGCRAGELGGIRVSEVRLDERHPHIVIKDNQYRTTKGSYRRNVPVLDALIRLGFDKFVRRIEAAGHDRLFHDWKPPAGRIEAGATAWSNASLIRAFNRTVIPQQLGSILAPGVRQEVTFHSFRGAFKTLLGRSEYNIPDNYKHEVIGHAKSALDKRYVQEIPLADTYPAIKACAYDGLVLPPAP
jgi:integrase